MEKTRQNIKYASFISKAAEAWLKEGNAMLCAYSPTSFQALTQVKEVTYERRHFKDTDWHYA